MVKKLKTDIRVLVLLLGAGACASMALPAHAQNASDVQQREEGANGQLPRLPVVVPLAAPAPNADPDVVAANKQAYELMQKGRDALAGGRNEEAVEVFNQLLLLMPNDYTQSAQEWVGVARERAGQITKAKIEYELYLKLYDSGAGVSAVKRRLAGLGGASDETKPKMDAGPEKKEKTRTITYGAVTSRYYYGKVDNATSYVFNNSPTTDNYSMTDQSSLVTSLDLSGRYLSENYDGRLVLREVFTQNFINSQPSTNRIYDAYAEIKGRTNNYLVRAGRQSSSGAGVQGRFDGVAGGYGVPEEWRINASAGVLTDFSGGSSPTFAGTSLDRGPFSIFFVSQSLEGNLDRRAVGGEYRYFDQDKTAYALLDYDTYFRILNTAMFMGTLSVGSGTTYNLMLDRRRSPTMSIRNALNGATTSSVDTLVQALGADRLRELAKERTATSNYTQFGMMQALTEKWQAGGDFKISNISGLPTSGSATGPEGLITATPSTGMDKSVSAQLIGNNVLRAQDVWSASASLSKSNIRDGLSLFLYNHLALNPKLSLDSSCMLYWQNDQVGGKLTRVSPMVRTSYQYLDRLSFDADAGFDYTNSSGPTSTTKATRLYFSAGVRWEF